MMYWCGNEERAKEESQFSAVSWAARRRRTHEYWREVECGMDVDMMSERMRERARCAVSLCLVGSPHRDSTLRAPSRGQLPRGESNQGDELFLGYTTQDCLYRSPAILNDSSRACWLACSLSTSPNDLGGLASGSLRTTGSVTRPTPACKYIAFLALKQSLGVATPLDARREGLLAKQRREKEGVSSDVNGPARSDQGCGYPFHVSLQRVAIAG